MSLSAPGEVSGACSCPAPTVGAPICTRRGVWCMLLPRTNSCCPYLNQERCLVHALVPHQREYVKCFELRQAFCLANHGSLAGPRVGASLLLHQESGLMYPRAPYQELVPLAAPALYPFLLENIENIPLSNYPFKKIWPCFPRISSIEKK